MADEESLRCGPRGALAGAPLVCDTRMVAGGITRREASALLDPRRRGVGGGRAGRAGSRARRRRCGWPPASGPARCGSSATRPPRCSSCSRARRAEPALIVGLPVGFVGAAEAKAALAASALPFRRQPRREGRLGRRGGGGQRAALLRRGRAVKLGSPDGALLATLPAPHRCLSSAVLGGGLATRAALAEPPGPPRLRAHRPRRPTWWRSPRTASTRARSSACSPPPMSRRARREPARHARWRPSGSASRSPPPGAARTRSRRSAPSTCSCSSTRRSTDGALVAAVQTATEAKAQALADAGIRAAQPPGPATGTATDAICIAAPPGGDVAVRRAGRRVGAAIAHAVHAAVLAGARVRRRRRAAASDGPAGRRAARRASRSTRCSAIPRACTGRGLRPRPPRRSSASSIARRARAAPPTPRRRSRSPPRSPPRVQRRPAAARRAHRRRLARDARRAHAAAHRACAWPTCSTPATWRAPARSRPRSSPAARRARRRRAGARGLESLAENTADAVAGPLVWTAVAGAPGAVAYRAANTLDAMVGYRDGRYRDFGWARRASTTRSTGPSPAHRRGHRRGGAAGRGARRRAAAAGARGGATATATPAPTAASVEAAFAGALGVRLGGANGYGDARRAPPAPRRRAAAGHRRDPPRRAAVGLRRLAAGRRARPRRGGRLGGARGPDVVLGPAARARARWPSGSPAAAGAPVAYLAPLTVTDAELAGTGRAPTAARRPPEWRTVESRRRRSTALRRAVTQRRDRAARLAGHVGQRGAVARGRARGPAADGPRGRALRRSPTRSTPSPQRAAVRREAHGRRRRGGGLGAGAARAPRRAAGSTRSATPPRPACGAADRALLVVAGRRWSCRERGTAAPSRGGRHEPRCRALLHLHGDELARGARDDLAVNVVAGGPPAWLRERSPPRSTASAPTPTSGRRRRGGRAPRPPARRGRAASTAPPGVLAGRRGARAAPARVRAPRRSPSPRWRCGPPGTRAPRAASSRRARARPATSPTTPTSSCVGNPTNPTGVLHPARRGRRALPRPGRTRSSTRRSWTSSRASPRRLAAERELPGLVVVRSLTKLYGAARPACRLRARARGPRAARLRAQRPGWSVNALALAATEACAADRTHAPRVAPATAPPRADLAARLARRPRRDRPPRSANFVLVHLPDAAGAVDGPARAGHRRAAVRHLPRARRRPPARRGARRDRARPAGRGAHRRRVPMSRAPVAGSRPAAIRSSSVARSSEGTLQRYR